MRNAKTACCSAVLLLVAMSDAWSQATVDVQQIADTMVRLCIGGGKTQAVAGTAAGSADLSLRSMDVRGNLTGEFKVNKSSAEGLSEGINNALSQVAADQADKVRECLKPVRERLLDILLPAPHASEAPTFAPKIGGIWRDNWGVVFQISQDGNAFRFSAQGTSCNGRYFQSSGQGTITGNSVESMYRSTVPSMGRCAGIISASGMEVSLVCSDQVCGQFRSLAIRQ
jgi:hypothetical protein